MKTKLCLFALLLAVAAPMHAAPYPPQFTVPPVSAPPKPVLVVDVATLIARLEREADDNQRMAVLFAPYSWLVPGAQLYFQGRADGIRQSIQIVRTLAYPVSL